MKNKITVFGIIKFIVIIALLGVAIYEAVMIYNDQSEYVTAEKEYDTLAESYVRLKDDPLTNTTDKSVESGSPAVAPGYPDLDIDFNALIKKNSDFIAWLYVPALDINYPIVKENEIDQYLYLTFDKKYNKSGCIFMDVLSNPSFAGPSDFIFGHNMKNLTMFGKLRYLYQNGHEDILEKPIYVYIYTPTSVYQYQIYSFYSTQKGSFSYTEVNGEAEYEQFVDYTIKNSIYTPIDEVSFTGCPPLLTLSTCAGQSGSDHRFVVHSVRTASFSYK